MLIDALEQLPPEALDEEILVRAGIGGASHDFTQTCGDADIRFSVGYELTASVRQALLEPPEAAIQSGDRRRARAARGCVGTELTDHVELRS